MNNTNILFEELRKAVKEKKYIKKYRESGRKIIGTFCNNVPEEVIHSSGAVPVRVFGFHDTTPNAISVMPQWVCHYARNVVESGLRGENEHLNGIVSTTSDDTKIHLFSVYRYYMKPEFSYLIQYPFSRDEKSRRFFEKELERFSGFLSRFTGNEINEESIKNSVEVYNEFRRVCMNLEKLRTDERVKLSGSEWILIMLGSMYMLKEDFVRIASELYYRISEREGNGEYRIRAHLSGTDFYSTKLIELLERNGIAVVSDDFCTSAGYYSGLVYSPDFRGIAERYLYSTACVMTSSSNELSVNERIKFIKERIKSSKAEAMIVLRDRGCEVCGHQCPDIIESVDVPVLAIDIDFPVAEGQIENRVEAFVESFGGFACHSGIQ